LPQQRRRDHEHHFELAHTTLGCSALLLVAQVHALCRAAGITVNDLTVWLLFDMPSYQL
jgi:hypothetical protein